MASNNVYVFDGTNQTSLYSAVLGVDGVNDAVAVLESAHRTTVFSDMWKLDTALEWENASFLCCPVLLSSWKQNLLLLSLLIHVL